MAAAGETASAGKTFPGESSKEEIPQAEIPTGEMLLGRRAVLGSGASHRAFSPSNGAELPPDFPSGTPQDVDSACALAEAAFDPFRSAGLEARASLLEAIAENVLALGDTLVARVVAESGLPQARIEGERARTVGQLRLFASLAREGRWLEATIDRALPDRKPLPRPDLRAQKIPLGPVAVFGASNFPLAFSVAGGDTASALAAGCPVVAKSHPSHPGASELVGRAIQRAVAHCGLPEGVFSLLVGAAEVGEALVQHPAIQAVGFTGSRKVGRRLVALASARPVPIPVYAEMSSVNPVFLLPAALAERPEEIARGLVDSVTLGVGQFCTKPGLVFAVAGPHFERLVHAASAAVHSKPSAAMLNPGIFRAFCEGSARWAAAPGVQPIVDSAAPAAPPADSPASSAAGPIAGQPQLFRTSAAQLLASPHLLEEVFGPAALLVECASPAELIHLARSLEGQLTATLHLSPADYDLARELLPILERKAGRVLVNGFPTGVEVSFAMVHGGPWPSTSDSRSTSVGAMAIDRFLRPVCYQNLPVELLPQPLQDANPLRLQRLVEGKLESA